MHFISNKQVVQETKTCLVVNVLHCKRAKQICYKKNMLNNKHAKEQTCYIPNMQYNKHAV